MPRRSKGPRLLLRKERRGKSGRVVQNATWVILDTINGRHEKSTRCGVNDRQGAERALADYLAHKYLTEVSRDERDPAHIPIADVLALYTRDIAPETHASDRNSATDHGVARVLRRQDADTRSKGSFAASTYEHERPTPQHAVELEDLRAAINHHRREGLCSLDHRSRSSTRACRT